jgi:hypothetical protein
MILLSRDRIHMQELHCVSRRNAPIYYWISQNSFLPLIQIWSDHSNGRNLYSPLYSIKKQASHFGDSSQPSTIPRPLYKPYWPSSRIYCLARLILFLRILHCFLAPLFHCSDDMELSHMQDPGCILRRIPSSKRSAEDYVLLLQNLHLAPRLRSY